MDWDARVSTAGAFVWTRGCFVFMFGPNQKGTRLGVVRLGGHRERGESNEACALREVREEASLPVRLVSAPATYFVGSPIPLPGQPLPRIAWTGGTVPLLVAERADGTLSVLYLAVSDDLPTPAAETKGLLLPSPQWLARICARRYTLEQYLSAGGEALVAEPMGLHLPLEPSYQIRLLNQLLRTHRELLPALQS
ncbi:MAG: NUDIX domain-containing protein [Bacillota bacterium]